MDTTTILNELRSERNRIDQAISALEALDGTGRLAVTTPKTLVRGRRKGITAAGRKRLSELAKARWAARRKQAAKLTSTKTARRKPMSGAARKRLSLLAKRRWAARKKAAKA